MRAGIIGFAAGILWLQHQPALPGWVLLCFLFFCAILAIRFRDSAWFSGALRGGKGLLRLIAGILLGVCWATVCAQWYLHEALDREWEGVSMLVTGTVASLPQRTERGTQFHFSTESAFVRQNAVDIPSSVALMWNKPSWGDVPDIRPGERWQLRVRLARPHGNVNPHAFDYEAWLLTQRIRATGHVQASDTQENHLRDEWVFSPSNVVNLARYRLRERIRSALPDDPYASVIVALVIGDQHGISPSDRDLFNRTGISHLIAISGLHITLIAGMFAACISFVWRRAIFTRISLPLVLPAQKVAAAVGAGTAYVYVLLAGFGVPAQRTLYMLIIVAVALWLGRISQVTHILLIALGTVLVMDPWAVMSAGFWLSFGAVAVILYATAGRVTARSGRISLLSRGWRAIRAGAHLQMAITIGFVPFSLLFFGRISLVSPLANAVAIPLVGTIVTPLSLVGSILPDFLAKHILGLSAYLVQMLVFLLQWLNGLPWATWTAPVPSLWFLLFALAGTMWLLAPAGFPARWMGIFCWIPLFFSQPAYPEQGEVRATALDVGQGSAVLIETRHHRLLYDTGPAYARDNSAASRIILPYLNARGIDALDMLLISHSDSDHAGGAPFLLGSGDIRIQQIYSSLLPDALAVQMAGNRHRLCLSGQTWEWDGVRFDMLSPTEAIYLEAGHESNAESCVLRVSAGDQHMLLTGDISEEEESDLIRRFPDSLRADILLVPHHGSLTSSSIPFLVAVNPGIALFQAGYRNRYGHPDPFVYASYGAMGIRRFRTDEQGAIVVRFGKGIDVRTWRQEEARYWHGR
ncbi:MAG: DNA internalization-related competence protein ComEC/Rec2 [Burkholderiaceae bacterium]|jgi:competence protein ComEC|nr:DNA internalization-related competence protein ComEC/Rec2 [Burkholderiaceae bacterium]